MVLAGVAQNYPTQTRELPPVTITEERARDLMRQLTDLDAFMHAVGIKNIANDQRLEAFATGFAERNQIEAFTIGYIDSDELWPRVFRNIRLKKLNNITTDQLLAAHILFIPQDDGYTVELKLEGKTTEVYELLELTKEEVNLIAKETSDQQLGSTVYAKPKEARETVVSAMIAALQRVEGNSRVDNNGDDWVVDSEENVSQGGSGSGGSDTGNPTPSDSTNQISPDSLLIVQARLMTELITYFDNEIDYWLLNNGKGPLDMEEIRRLQELPSCLPDDEGQLERIQTALNGLVEDVSGFLTSLFETEDNQETLDEICQDLDTTQESLLTQLTEDELATCEEMLCEYLEEEEVEYTIVLRDDGEEIEAGAYVLITAEPEMPALSVEAVSESTSEIEVKLRLKIEYRRDIRQDEDYFPANGWYETNLNEEWEIDFGDRIRGGRATLYTEIGESRDTIIFHIRGTNPTAQAVQDYIEEEDYDDTWFFTRLIRQESNYIHFNNGTNYGPEWTDSQGCPNWGPPHGWGLCQLDLLAGGQRPTAQELWSWKANVDRGYDFLTGEKFNIAEVHIAGEMVAVNTWNTANPTDLVEGHADQEEGNNTNSVTYTYASSDSFDFDWGDLDAGSESFLDAVWIKSYNGNSRGYYYRLVAPTREGEKPEWELRRTNIHDHNYVGAVSGRAE
ncbi:hypothetical protein C7460_105167 [Marinoscillum furvescens DSM 4134]|uniref:Uncharacterized protein n=2 Tax=Marinoscillum furvescens TaxID=1026 RepID=A0A3D9L740_MARFU|nr:hypothetical protein C7460_105167 [Marinoscillum furvescens DSM 4134]